MWSRRVRRNGEFNSAASAGFAHQDFVTDGDVMARKKVEEQWPPVSVPR